MHTIVYLALRTVLGFFAILGLKLTYIIALILTPIFYVLIPKYRKRALSNLKLAKELNLTDRQIKKTAFLSLFNLLLTALEYGKLYNVKSVKSFCTCLNSQGTDALLDKKKGVIFFCGHQSNWELLFLDATSRHKGVCIGKPIKNKRLYNFILTIRQKFSGRVIMPKDAYKGCMKALKDGQLVGVVGDQGLPESPFSYNCLGRNAHMTTLPALLSQRSDCPIYVATILRKFGQYQITYTGPILSDDGSTESLTLKSLKVLDDKIKEHPEQYMWQHNRWKISYNPQVPKKFRHDAIAVILGKDRRDHDKELKTLKTLFEGAYFILFKPWDISTQVQFDEIISYYQEKECFITHFGPKMIIDLAHINGLKWHFKRQAVLQYLKPSSIKQLFCDWNISYAD